MKFSEIEQKWQKYWADNNIYHVENDYSKPKFYVLDMFPYPSGAGLHVGHPLGYIATDIFSRFKRLQGFNVLHPMGFDSFGLPAEQYAIETGQHPAITTENNIATFKKQLSKIGFNYDWNHEVRTSSPEYYRWTQWIFQQLFNAWFNKKTNKAEHIDSLIAIFESKGNNKIKAASDDDLPVFSADEWETFSEKKQQEILLNYRLTYVADSVVNWCPALGTVLANDEIKDGRSERGNHPVERKKMKQWMMRITAYADRLLENLNDLDWSDALKEMQRNWIGKSYGAELDFKVENKDITLTVFTTRPDTIFGVTFVSIAPEHELLNELVTAEQKQKVDEYVQKAVNRSDLERQTESKTASGVFTGAYVINPISGEKAPLWVADYVLASYGTGVVMAVPGSDDRDYRFAKHFELPIIAVVEGTDIEKEAYTDKSGKMMNSGFLDGMEIKNALKAVIQKAEEIGVGKGKVNYKLRNAVFSRQRYWGEPVPVYFKENIPYLVPEENLPLLLPEIDEYKPTAEGEPPLGRATDWKFENEFPYELTTMPGWAGSSWYFLRYMNPKNKQNFVSKEASDYWNQVDLYIGGTEHAVGHLLYARFWTNVLHDLGHISFNEPFKKLVNQGMIQGQSSLVYRIVGENKFVSADKKPDYETQELHVYINFVENGILDIEAYKNWREDEEWQSEMKNAEFILSDDGNFYCGTVVEKMSKRWYNVVNPDDVIQQYSADTLRLYEMFLGPLEQAKPWNVNGIEGVYRFLKKLYAYCVSDSGELLLNDEAANKAELKLLHSTIKKVTEDIEKLSLNTCVSQFMIFLNEAQKLKSKKKAIFEPFVILISPFAPHLAEEIWEKLGHSNSIVNAEFPAFDEKYLMEDEHEYPVAINGKVRVKMSFSADLDKDSIQAQVEKNEEIQKWMEGKELKKFILIPKRMINLVIK